MRAKTFILKPGQGKNVVLSASHPNPSSYTGRVVDTNGTVVTTNVRFNVKEVSFSVPGSYTEANLPAVLTLYVTKGGGTGQAFATITLSEGLVSNEDTNLPGLQDAVSTLSTSLSQLTQPDIEERFNRVSSGKVGYTIVLDTNNPSQFTSDLNAAVAAGAGWLRIGLDPWQIGGFYGTFGAGGQWYWLNTELNNFASAIQQSKAKGMKISLTLAAQSNNAEWTNAQWLTINREYWIKVAETVRDAGGVEVVQVFNEDDAKHYRTQASFGGALPTSSYLSAFASVLSTARTAFKSVLPNVVVTTSCTGFPCNDDTENRWNVFFDGVAGSLDAISPHTYTGDWIEQIDNLPARINRLKARYNKPIILTETGAPSESGGAISEDRASILIARLVSRQLETNPMAVIVYQLRNRGTNATDPEHNFGILANNGTKRGTYSAVSSAARNGIFGGEFSAHAFGSTSSIVQTGTGRVRLTTGSAGGYSGTDRVQIATIRKDISDADIVVKYVPESLSESYLAIVARASSPSIFLGNNSGYYLHIEQYGNGTWGWNLMKRSNQTNTSIYFSGAMPAPTLGVPRNFRLRVDGNQIKVRTWLDSKPEPRTWGFSGIDSTIMAQGHVAVDLGGGPNPASVTQAVDNIAIYLR